MVIIDNTKIQIIAALIYQKKCMLSKEKNIMPTRTLISASPATCSSCSELGEYKRTEKTQRFTQIQKSH